MSLDLLIIGASAAGSSAAIYAARRKLNFEIVTKDIGGEVALSGVVDNWPGTIKTDGFTLAQNFHDHLKSYNVKINEGWLIKDIQKNDNLFTIIAQNSANKQKEWQAKAVIITSGIHPRFLGLPNEETYRGKGVTYCTVCDGPLFHDKITATIGAGNSALESVIMMAGIAKKVYLITKFPDTKEMNGGFPKGENTLIDKVKTLPNVEIIYSADTKEIIGDKLVKGLKYLDQTNNTLKELAVNGVMIHVGNVPNSDFVTICDKTPTNEIVVDAKCQTNVPGLLAAGDVTNVPYKQIVISAGQGVIASLAAIEYINRWK